jgi:hypothetical protein
MPCSSGRILGRGGPGLLRPPDLDEEVYLLYHVPRAVDVEGLVELPEVGYYAIANQQLYRVLARKTIREFLIFKSSDDEV